MTIEEKYPNFAQLTALLNWRKRPRKTLIVVEFANASYQEGLNGEENTITMNSVRESYRACKENIDSSIRRWEIICWLCDKAYQEGKEAAHHE